MEIKEKKLFDFYKNIKIKLKESRQQACVAVSFSNFSLNVILFDNQIQIKSNCNVYNNIRIQKKTFTSLFEFYNYRGCYLQMET